MSSDEPIPGSRPIFVFGSNLAGRHGRGSAKEAVKNHGAIYGQGFGLQGSSYAIPTKDENLKILPLTLIYWYVQLFLDYARWNPELTFNVVEIGCGLAGYLPKEIAPMFRNKTENVLLSSNFQKIINELNNEQSPLGNQKSSIGR